MGQAMQELSLILSNERNSKYMRLSFVLISHSLVPRLSSHGCPSRWGYFNSLVPRPTEEILIPTLVTTVLFKSLRIIVIHSLVGTSPSVSYLYYMVLGRMICGKVT